MTKQEFRELVQAKTLLLDGATGSNLMKEGMPRGVCSEQWVYENPQVLQKLQKEYCEAGSKIVYASTFSANRISLANHGLEDKVEELNRGLVRVSRTLRTLMEVEVRRAAALAIRHSFRYRPIVM